MVKLDKIYTRGGDGGQTSLVGGKRVLKHHLRVESYGSVDEASSALGVAATLTSGVWLGWLRHIQNDLFDLGADLATPFDDEEADDDEALRIVSEQVTWLESRIDEVNATLEPLTSFILPGGTALSAALHMARAITRRAERVVSALAHNETVSPQCLIYLNRLSDLLFVLARVANEKGKADVLWVPANSRSS